MKHFLHIGLGRLYSFSDLINDGKWFQLDSHLELKSNKKWKLWACDCKHYSKEQLLLIEKSDWIDNFIHKDICDQWSDVPLFDKWDCTSVMEHVKAEDAEKFVSSLRTKVSNNSTGYIHVDLSDHSKEGRGKQKFEDNNFAATYYDQNDAQYKMYLNRISGNRWKEYFSEHFIFDIKHEEETYITFDNVKPKNKDE